jgi:hypothetical protein
VASIVRKKLNFTSRAFFSSHRLRNRRKERTMWSEWLSRFLLVWKLWVESIQTLSHSYTQEETSSSFPSTAPCTIKWNENTFIKFSRVERENCENLYRTRIFWISKREEQRSFLHFSHYKLARSSSSSSSSSLLSVHSTHETFHEHFNSPSFFLRIGIESYFS